MIMRKISLDDLDENFVDDVKKLEGHKKEIEESSDILLDLMASVNKSKNAINKIQKQMAQEKMMEYRELSEEYRDVKQKLDDFPQMIKGQKERISEAEEIVQEYKEEIDLMESTFMMEINQDKDENGKKKYSNKSMRKAALNQRIEHNPEYQEQKQNLQEAERELEQAEFELDRIYNEFKSVRKIADMLANRMGMLG